MDLYQWLDKSVANEARPVCRRTNISGGWPFPIWIFPSIAWNFPSHKIFYGVLFQVLPHLEAQQVLTHQWGLFSGGSPAVSLEWWIPLCMLFYVRPSHISYYLVALKCFAWLFFCYLGFFLFNWIDFKKMFRKLPWILAENGRIGMFQTNKWSLQHCVHAPPNR